MALVHDFFIVDDLYDDDDDNLYKDTGKIEVQDFIILYINDSLRWIKTKWNNKKEKQGLNYYGYSVIQEENISRLRLIIKGWIELFINAPDEFHLKGNYLSDEHKYEKIIINKKQLINQLTDLLELCDSAIDYNMNILHRGI